MCGIAGVFSFTPLTEDIVSPMVETLRHRGPDGSHICYVTPRGRSTVSPTQPYVAALGHTRLALVGGRNEGRQPLTDARRRVVAAVNGEIYNHSALRSPIASGPDDCDCDVVPELVTRYGTRGLARLSGVFAGAAVDLRDMSLLLFRDPLGARPLYYARTSTAVVFASEVKALLAVPGITARLDHRAAVEYFAVQSPLGPRTLFEGITVVEPGCCVHVSAGGVLRSASFRDALPGDRPPSFGDAAEALRDLLEESVARQWHPRAAAYLSSGVDTNAIVSTLTVQGRRTTTFTVGFNPAGLDAEEAGRDESTAARALAAGYGMRHTTVPLRARDLQGSFAALVRHLEDLRMPMSFGAWRVSGAAAPSARVLLSGMGADELFGGYVGRLKELPGHSTEDEWLASYAAAWERRMTTARERSALFSGELATANAAIRPTDEFRTLLAALPAHTGPVRRLLAVEQSFFLPGLLVVDDRMSMAHGVETRIPLADTSIADFAASLPDDHLVRDGLGKAVLRAAIADRVPSAVHVQPKMAFRVPESSWYKGELREWVRDTLLGDRAVSREFLDASTVRRFVEEHVSGRAVRRHLLWSLLCFEYWCRIFLADGDPDGDDGTNRRRGRVAEGIL
ncbi:asparagine synthetase B [Streptomyces sp. Y2F8-2]|uniref:asparagine synthase (glutamine-hydrolyzing) n=1 Tax=Streptomyces sp. Y2F8-2 TaxID=2759675 RepID=UPI001907C70E|nr:asparagine synthase (glutamine-hydrolyzing) [Streptomyces sp. Y2F8-2]GHK01682.1 asparagine synthetase B [Streptomyces sp. Y2F8-2]